MKRDAKKAIGSINRNNNSNKNNNSNNNRISSYNNFK